MITKDRMDWWRILAGTGKSGGTLARACQDVLDLQAENVRLRAELDRIVTGIEAERAALDGGCSLCGGTGVVPGTEEPETNTTGEPCACRVRGER